MSLTSFRPLHYVTIVDIYKVKSVTAACHARVRGSFAGLGGLKETTKIPPQPLIKLNIVGSLRDREVACLG